MITIYEGKREGLLWEITSGEEQEKRLAEKKRLHGYKPHHICKDLKKIKNKKIWWRPLCRNVFHIYIYISTFFFIFIYIYTCPVFLTITFSIFFFLLTLFCMLDCISVSDFKGWRLNWRNGARTLHDTCWSIWIERSALFLSPSYTAEPTTSNYLPSNVRSSTGTACLGGDPGLFLVPAVCTSLTVSKHGA